MTRTKYTYRASVQNESGAGESAGSSYNLNELKAEVRARYGAGWKVTITRIQHSEGNGWFEPEVVATFTLRK